MPRVLIASLLVEAALSFRLHFTATKNLQLSNQSEVPYRPETGGVSIQSGATNYAPISSVFVDFAWMTTDLSYQLRQATVWGWIQRSLFGGRREFSELKDELVTGHSCNQIGSRWQTYYASSMCYWIPDIQSPLAGVSHGSQGPGLKWIKTQPGEQLCTPFSGAGRCMKCSVCHNNGRMANGSVHATNFEEDVLALPPDCLKESQVEVIVNGEFDGNHTELAEERYGCEAIQNRYNASVKALNDCLENQRQLRDQIDDLNRQIYDLEQRRSGYQRDRDDGLRRESSARSNAQNSCRPWSGESWYRMLGNSWYSGRQCLNSWPSFWCYPPVHPYCDVWTEWDCRARIDQYERELVEYHECRTCSNAKGPLRSAVDAVEQAERNIERMNNEIRDKERERSNAENALRLEEQREPGLREDLRLREEEWFPERDRCLDCYHTYWETLKPWMVNHVPTFYDRSCEKACIESSLADAGCGVMEGVMRGEIWSRDDDANGGIDVVCSPPYASFLKTPVKYGAQPETELEMCTRIFQNAGQRPRRPQQVVKKGLLWKRERLWMRWRTRYFILESGDQVRSAQMRYWTKDPSEEGAKQRGTKAIILWDAKSAYPVSGRTYRWRGGEQCFRIEHFYRRYHLCTQGSNYTADYDPTAERDAWVNLIAPSITFPAVVR